MDRNDGDDSDNVLDMDLIKEDIHQGFLVQVDDPGKVVPNTDHGFVFVNDHGNITLYDCAGNVTAEWV